MNPYTLLIRQPDGSRPVVTHYAGPEARIELSAISLANGVAKAAGLLRDGLGLTPGATVSVDLPLHWQMPVWTLGALAVGARVERSASERVAARVVGPDDAALSDVTASPADDVLVSSCDAFGLPIPGGVAAGLLDVGVEARAYPDVFSPEPGADAEAALRIGRELVNWGGLAESLGVAGAGPSTPGTTGGTRSWLGVGDVPDELLLWACIRPLLTRGSIVLASDVAPGDAARLRQVEGVPA